MEKTSRINRGLTQQIYLLEKISNLEYKVMGTSGKPYIITIAKHPKCTCPDHFIRHKRCKHIYFVLIRIMNVADPEKKEYSEENIAEMINNIPAMVDIFSNDRIYIKKHSDEIDVADKIVEPKIDDNCPICLDDVKTQPFQYCCKCGKCVHIECMNMWIKHGKKENKCIYCKNKHFIDLSIKKN
jgi:predicted SprT family Zn-dependent metalloprotease